MALPGWDRLDAWAADRGAAGPGISAHLGAAGSAAVDLDAVVPALEADPGDFAGCVPVIPDSEEPQAGRRVVPRLADVARAAVLQGVDRRAAAAAEGAGHPVVAEAGPLEVEARRDLGPDAALQELSARDFRAAAWD